MRSITFEIISVLQKIWRMNYFTNCYLRYSMIVLSSILMMTFPLTISAQKQLTNNDAIVWKFKGAKQVNNLHPLILGNPVFDTTNATIGFDGIDDGLVIPFIPFEGWPAFTIEVLFKPASNGPVAPRFIHFQDSLINRGTMELRLTPGGEWYLDTFLKNSDTAKSNKGLTLIDSSLLHPSDTWHWAALVYDGTTMTSYVNGKKELEGKIRFPPVTSGKLAVGVRLNKVNWYKGLIKEIFFHPSAVPISQLKRF
jgi:hypothetical protein